MGDQLAEPRDLFLKELAELLYVERALADEVLPKLHEQVENKHFREGIEEHLEQTREHVANLERLFELMGEPPRTDAVPAFDGLKGQQEESASKLGSGLLRDLFNAGVAAHTEHYEISAYHGLLTLASILGEPDAVHLLEENLHDEEETLEKVEKSIPDELTTQLVS